MIKITNGANSRSFPQSNTTSNLTSVFFSSQNIGYAVSSDNSIIKSTDGGNTWNQASGTITNLIRQLFFVSDNIGFAIGCINLSGTEYRGVILKTINGGVIWDTVNITSSFDYYDFTDWVGPYGFRSVFFKNVNEGYALSDFNALYKTTDGGSTWVYKASIGGYGYGSIQFIDNDIGYVMSGTTLYKTIDGGNTWNIIYAFPSGFEPYSSMHFVSNNVGYITINAGIYKTVNGGLSWQLSPVQYSLEGKYSITSLNKDSVFITFSSGYEPYTGILMDLDNDNNWQTFGEPSYTNDFAGSTSIQSISLLDSLHGFAVGVGVMKTFNGGKSWYGIDTTLRKCKDVCFVTKKTGILVGNRVYKTTDAGNSWIEKYVPNQFLIATYFNSVFFIDSLRGFVGGNNGVVLKTTDGGETFTSYTINPSYNFSSVFFPSENIGYAAGNTGSSARLYKTINGGSSWTIAKDGLASAQSYPYVYFINDTIGFLGNVSNTTGFFTNYYIWKTTNGGNSWTAVSSSFTGNNMIFRSDSVGYVVGGNKVYKTKDMGNNWHSLFPNFSGNANDIFFVNDSLSYAAGDCGGAAAVGGVYKNYHTNKVNESVANYTIPDPICVNESITLSSTSQYADDHFWYINNSYKGNYSIYFPPAFSIPGTYTITLIAGNIDYADTLTKYLTVSPATFNLYIPNQIACEGQSTQFVFTSSGSGLAYQWQLNSGSGFVDITDNVLYGGINTATLSVNNASLTLNNYKYRCVFSGCKANTTNYGTLTVRTIPTFTLDPVSQTTCEGGGNIFFTASATGTSVTYQWQLNSGGGYGNLANGGNYSGVTTKTLTISGSMTALNGYQYRCIASGTCSPADTSLPATLNVGTAPFIATQPFGQTICNNQNTSFSVNSYGNSLTYQWQVNTGSGFNNVTNGGVYSGAITKKLSITTAPSAMSGYQYKCIVSGCNPLTQSVSDIANLTVFATYSVVSVGTSMIPICEGGSVSTCVIVTGEHITYQWQVKVSGSNTYVNLSNDGIHFGVDNDTLTIINATASMNGNRYHCFVSNWCYQELINPLNSQLLTVYKNMSIVTQPTDQAVNTCTDAKFNFSATGSTVTYKWQVNSGSGFTNLSNDGNHSGVFTPTLTVISVPPTKNGYKYRCIASSLCTPNDTSNVVTLSVPPSLSSLQDKTACTGGDADISINASTNINHNFTRWQVNSGSGFVNIVTGSPYSVTNTTYSSTLNIKNVSPAMNGYQYRCYIQGTCYAGYSDTSTLFVNSTTTFTITSQPTPNISVCVGDNPNFTVTAIGTGQTYQWQSDNGTGVYTNITDNLTYSGSQNSVLNIANISNTFSGYQYKCIVSNSGSCYVSSSIAKVTVNSAPTIISSPENVIACAGSNAIFNVSVGGTNLSYKWQVNNGSGFVDINNGGVYSNATTPSLQISGLTTAMNGYVYRCAIFGCNGTLNSNVATLQIANVVILSQPVNQSVCVGSNAQYLISASGIGLTYQWQQYFLSGATVDLVNNSIYNGVNTATLSITGVTTNMNSNYYRCSITSYCSAITTNSISLGVYASPTITSQPNNVSVCSGLSSKFKISVTSSASVTYQWQENSGSGFMDINNGGYYSGVTTPTLTINNVQSAMDGYQYRCIVSSCSSLYTSNSASIAVSPSPTVAVTTGGSTTFCQGNSVSLNANTGTGYTYQWKLNGSNINGATNPTYIASQSGKYYISITNNCASINSSTITVVANSLPAPVINGNLGFCQSLSTILTGNGGINYFWAPGSLTSQVVSFIYPCNCRL